MNKHILRSFVTIFVLVLPFTFCAPYPFIYITFNPYAPHGFTINGINGMSNENNFDEEINPAPPLPSNAVDDENDDYEYYVEETTDNVPQYNIVVDEDVATTPETLNSEAPTTITTDMPNSEGPTTALLTTTPPAPTSSSPAPPYSSPTTAALSTPYSSPTIAAPATIAPTTFSPTATAPTTFSPKTIATTTTAPTTTAPTTTAPTTTAPTSAPPTTAAPTSAPPTIASPTPTYDSHRLNCVGVAPWNSAGMTEWCTLNCNNVPKYCPASHCAC